ncbi:FAD/NAD(P)-binding protein [uncultured Sphingomonas sp.]|uniref:FAD/NAD(P)-binding protein n=1 Tax=uncultured Sphingomonas sp. TaxID=158754 RepID=UPI0025D6825B|nr:FAD/NAD(P)-binding protein [uncultured Sphingomonas sp.]
MQEPPSGGPRSSNPSKRTARIEAFRIHTKDRHDLGERIAIVGAGATGTYVLDALLRSGVAREIAIFESSAALGPGLAYAEHLNAPHALSNIAGIEIPPLIESLNAWAVRQSPDKLDAWGIHACAGDDRAFFPRVALGAWLADQFAMIVAGSPIPISVQRQAEVVDVVAMPQGCRVEWRGTDGRIVQDQFDRLIVATGYGPIAANMTAAAARTGEPPTAMRRARQTERFGVLGSSLSAIDVVTAIATARGTFVPDGDTLTYVAETPWQATLLSRNGLLPEADYWFPHPLPSLKGFTPETAAATLRGEDGDLDRLFDQFIAVLRKGASDWAARLGLAEATADDFADRYFAARHSSNAWDYARHNLADVRHWHAHHDTPFWRIAILKAHEVFATAIPSLSKTDLARFHRGLKRVFTDNYAAVPHLSIERILALHDAGHLEAQALGNAYDIAPQQDGTCLVHSPNWTSAFDELLDARGSQTAALNHFPFPTLRLQLCASALEADQAWSSGLNPAGDLTMREQDSSLERVHLCALPFLLGNRPFVQGLVECAAMATAISGAIQEARGATDGDQISAAELLDVLERPSVILSDGAVLPLAGSKQ